MFWFIPLIVGAATAAAAGTSVANQAMDGALFAPEINTYKEEIRVETSVNEQLIAAINGEANVYSSDVASFNWLMEETNMMRKSFLVADSKASELAVEKLIAANPKFLSLPQTEVPQVYDVLVTGVGAIGGLQMIEGVSGAAAGSKIAADIGRMTATKLTMLRSFGQAASTRAMVAAGSLANISKVKPLASPILSAGSKALTVGLRTGQGVAQVLRAGSVALGPLAAIGSLALIGLDVAFSQERSNQLRQHRDEIRRHNDELRQLQNHNRRQMTRFREDRAAILKDEVLSFQYMAKVTLAAFGDGLPNDYPKAIDEIVEIDSLNALDAQLVGALGDFIDAHSTAFVTRRLEYHVSMVNYWKQIFVSCQIEPRQLVEADPVLGIMGLSFAEYIFATHFLGDAEISPLTASECHKILSAPAIDGPSVQAAELAQGRIFHQADGFWTFQDKEQRFHSYRETHRDPWSVYLVHRTDPSRRLQLDLWRRELIETSGSATPSVVSSVRAGYHVSVLSYEPVTPAPFEYDTDRYGSDYRQKTGIDFLECSKECAGDVICKSFTWTPSENRCYLKDQIPGRSDMPYSSLRSGHKI